MIKTILIGMILLAVTYAVFVVVMRFLFPLPSLDLRAPSLAIPVSQETTLGRAALSASATQNGLSGFRALDSGFDAFTARVLLARAAEETIDVQYYIWHNDMTGMVLLANLKEAAERGVRIRLLVDDNGIHDMDDLLAALDELPSMEVRIFNPFQIRGFKAASFLFDFPRLNRRMHNKSFTIDGAFTIVGGRNIGDIYFQAYESGVYFDLDMLATGGAAAAVSDSFDAYWASGSAHPVANLFSTKDGASVLTGFEAQVRDILASDRFKGFAQALGQSAFAQDLIDKNFSLLWTEFQLLVDDPAKGLSALPDAQLLITRLWQSMPLPEKSFDLVSAYFIPGKPGTAFLTGLAQNGVHVRTLTNSLEATDVSMVHSGYAKYRPKLVEAGIEVFELRAGVQDRLAVNNFGVMSFSTSSLHSKAFTIDDLRVFVGSFNFDPRSARLNCEMGFLIESPEISVRVRQGFERMTAHDAYQVRATDQGALFWSETQSDGTEITYQNEPHTSASERFFIKSLGWLPIEWAL